jgi:hypothetical protein
MAKQKSDWRLQINVHRDGGGKLAGDHALEQAAPFFAGCPAIIAVPVRDESQHIFDCLLALGRQSQSSRHGVLLLLNNCTDDTWAIAGDLASRLPIPIATVSVDLPAEQATAGRARRLAMEIAAGWLRPGGFLLTTDADGRVSPNWLAANLAALRAGADAVAGRAELDSADAGQIPARLHEDDARECAYDQLLDQIHALLDPDPFDPWPRHTEHSGASLAVTLEAYRRAGGIPPMPAGEDRAFVEALRRVDARIRHAPEVRVAVSGRIIGRAAGGMADTIRRRLARPDEMLDERLEPASTAARRAWMRGLLRHLWYGDVCPARAFQLLSTNARLPGPEISKLLVSRYFGEAWSELESRSPALRRQRVLTSNLAAETRRARNILGGLLNGSLKIALSPEPSMHIPGSADRLLAAAIPSGLNDGDRSGA